MNIVIFTTANKFLASSICFVGGYALNGTLVAVNQFAVKHLGSAIDIQEHQKYDEYTSNLVLANKEFADANGITLDRQLGLVLSVVTACAIREEISFRFLLETIVLPRICSRFAAFSAGRTCVSSLLFAAVHL